MNPLPNLKPTQVLVGQGSYGHVYVANDPNYVCKVYIPITPKGLPSNFVREVAILTHLQDHPNILKLTGSKINQSDSSKLEIYLPAYQHNLTQFMKWKKPFLSESIIKTIIYQILLGLRHAQKHGIIHRDLKPQNILINFNLETCICDWGLSSYIDDQESVQLSCTVQSQCYRAPEIILGNTYSPAIDIWSVGLIMCEMINQGQPLFSSGSSMDHLYNIFQMFGTPNLKIKSQTHIDPDSIVLDDFSQINLDTSEIWLNFEDLPYYNSKFPQWRPQRLKNHLKPISNTGLDLITKMLKINPENRISIEEALHHPYFTDCKISNQDNLKPIPDIYNLNLEHHSDIILRRRAHALHFIYKFRSKLRLTYPCLFLGTYYLDLILSQSHSTEHRLFPDKLQLPEDLIVIGLSAVWLASKVINNEIISVSQLKEIYPIVSQCYLKTEINIFKFLQGKLLYSSSLTERYSIDQDNNWLDSSSLWLLIVNMRCRDLTNNQDKD